jgi:hypothetical protein
MQLIWEYLQGGTAFGIRNETFCNCASLPQTSFRNPILQRFAPWWGGIVPKYFEHFLKYSGGWRNITSGELLMHQDR